MYEALDFKYNSNTYVRNINNFLERRKFQTPKACKYTNVIDQKKKGGSYRIPLDNTFENISFDTDFEKSREMSILEEHLAGDHNINKHPVDEFFELLEECRVHDVETGFCEKQTYYIPIKRKTLKPVTDNVFDNEDLEIIDSFGSSAEEVSHEDTEAIAEELSEDMLCDNSCIELDFDIYQDTNERLVQNSQYFVLIFNMCILLGQTLDFGKTKNPEGVVIRKSNTYDVIFHVALLRKPEVVAVNHKKYGNCWKDSFHIRIFLRTSKAYKKYYIDTLTKAVNIQSVFTGLGGVKNPSFEIIDPNSCNVPVMFLGSMKNGGTVPHSLYKLYKVTMTSWPQVISPIVEDISAFDPIPSNEPDIVTRDPSDRRKNKVIKAPPKYKYNLCYELSLNFENPKGLIKKREVPPRSEIDSEIQHITERVSPGLIPNEEIEDINIQVSTLTVRDYNAKYVKRIIDILNIKRIQDYKSWKAIIVMLAKENPEYKPLAIYMSQRCPESWAKDGMKHLEGIWDWALRNNEKNDDEDSENGSLSMLYSWAKEDNPEKYNEAQEFNAFMETQNLAMDCNGKLNENHFAKILKIMWGHFFITDESPYTKSRGRDRRWYAFQLMESTNYDSGNLYKWIWEKYPDDLDNYICEKLPLFLQKVIDFIKHKTETSSDETVQKYFITMKRNLEDSKQSLGKRSMIQNIISRCEIKFRRRGFIEELDKEPNIIGVGNGVLRLYPNTELIQRFHEIPISRSTKTPYIRENIDMNDPDLSTNHKNPYISKLFTEIKRLFAGEEDAFLYTMCFLASSLDGRKKNPLFYIWLGEGSNGKSFLLEMHIKTMFEVVRGGYAAKLNCAFFTKDSKSGGGPDSEKYMLKDARFAYCSESEKGDSLRMGKIKEFTSETLTASEKHLTQDMFEAICNYVFASNNDPAIIGRDYGTWRRILVYIFKMKFLDHPDPSNPIEYKCDVTLVQEVPYNPRYRQAYMSILMYFYEIYRNKYNCNLNNIPKPTIDRETQKYRDEQDTLEKFITQQLVHIGTHYPTGDLVKVISLSDIANKYIEWHRRKIGDIGASIKDIINDLPQTRLKKFIKHTNHDSFIEQHKLLGIGEKYKKVKDIQTQINELKNDPDNILLDDDY
jgi:phage/plasmid-associated DNA primase